MYLLVRPSQEHSECRAWGLHVLHGVVHGELELERPHLPDWRLVPRVRTTSAQCTTYRPWHTLRSNGQPASVSDCFNTALEDVNRSHATSRWVDIFLTYCLHFPSAARGARVVGARTPRRQCPRRRHSHRCVRCLLCSRALSASWEPVWHTRAALPLLRGCCREAALQLKAAMPRGTRWPSNGVELLQSSSLIFLPPLEARSFLSCSKLCSSLH